MSDFGVGLVVGQSMSKSNFAEMHGIALGWRDRAERLTNQLEEANSNAGALLYRHNAAVAVMKDMWRELAEANPESPYADKEFVRQRLAELTIQLAQEDGYSIDLQADRIMPLR